MSFEAQLLRAVSHSEGVTAASLATAAFSGATVTLNDPVWEVLINGNTDASVAPTGLVQLATLALEVKFGAAGVVTFIQATLVGLVTCSKCDDTDDNSSDGLDNEVGGSGYVLLPGGRRGRALTVSELPPRAATTRVGRALAQPDGSCCGRSVGVDAFYGDINGDCVFDIKDVRRASLLLLSQQPGSTDVPTEYQGVALCPWQQQQLDPTLDGAFRSNDAIYLLLVLSRKYRFVGSATLALTLPQQLDFQATLFDEHSSAANDQVGVRLELQYAPDGVTAAKEQLNYELGAAEEPALSSENNSLAKAAGLGGGTGVYSLRASGQFAWITGAEWRVAMMMETTDSLDNSQTTRRFPFFGSSAALYKAQGFSFEPFRVAVVRFPPPPLPGFPPALPKDAPLLPPPPPSSPPSPLPPSPSSPPPSKPPKSPTPPPPLTSPPLTPPPLTPAPSSPPLEPSLCPQSLAPPPLPPAPSEPLPWPPVLEPEAPPGPPKSPLLPSPPPKPLIPPPPSSPFDDMPNAMATAFNAADLVPLITFAACSCCCCTLLFCFGVLRRRRRVRSRPVTEEGQSCITKVPTEPLAQDMTTTGVEGTEASRSLREQMLPRATQQLGDERARRGEASAAARLRLAAALAQLAEAEAETSAAAQVGCILTCTF